MFNRLLAHCRLTMNHEPQNHSLELFTLPDIFLSAIQDGGCEAREIRNRKFNSIEIEIAMWVLNRFL